MSGLAGFSESLYWCGIVFAAFASLFYIAAAWGWRVVVRQAATSAGEVTLSEEAHRRVQPWLNERGSRVERVELKLKGFPEPVVGYRIKATAEAIATA